MAKKVFSTYKSGKERGTKNNDRIIVEVANAHVACIVVGGSSNLIEDFEFFELSNSRLINFEESFAYVVIGSRLLDKPYTDKKVFINLHQSVIVPGHLYSKESSSDYLNVIFGNNSDEVLNDDLNDHLQVSNVYRVPSIVKEVIEKNLAQTTFQHTYTNIIRRLFSEIAHLPPDFIKVQFYKSHFIVAVLIQHQLQLIQSYSYTTPVDVLYHLLNICSQFNLSGTLLQISGMIDQNSSMHDELYKYFKNISTDDADEHDLGIPIYSSYYFTPFFKLAQ